MQYENQKILILDFGSQYTQLIARLIRSLGVYCEIFSYHLKPEAIKKFSPLGIILSGGPDTAHEGASPKAPRCIFDLGCPVLGICYGMQTMALQLGGTVASAEKYREFGHAQLQVKVNNPLFKNLIKSTKQVMQVWMSHGDHVTTMPADFDCIASTDRCPIAAISNTKKRFYGLQFHPEVTHTPLGADLLSRFVFKICGCHPTWTATHIANQTIASIQKKVGTEEVVLGLSGGVDSSVAATLIHRAIGKQLTCIFVDTGLLRLNEAQEVKQLFQDNFHINLHFVNRKSLFLKALKGVVDPEEKRKIIGHLFVEVFKEEADKLKQATWLAQGTIYPDVIESAGTKTGKAKVIKSHHNVGGMPKNCPLKLLEPLRCLFKDEVRKLGTSLGLPNRMIHRHPFPGPGLAVRILGEVTEEAIHCLQKADAIFMQALRASGYYEKVSQAFAVWLPIKSVGVMGDNRHYGSVIALRAVETLDFMTATWAKLPYDFLDEVAHRIVNEVVGISRIVYDISGKPPATIEWE